MKRLGFIATLLGMVGVARAQKRYEAYTVPDWKQCDVPGNEISRVSTPDGCGHRMQMMVAKKNQCPVCGTMAEPYHVTGIDCAGIRGGPGDFNSCSKRSLARCQRCNAAFWQDAT